MPKTKATALAYKNCDVYRLLDHLYAQHKGQHPIFGDSIDPNADLVSIHSHVTFGHKASGVQQVTHEANGQYNILLNHLNLAGMYGPLPDAYGEAIADRNNQDMRDFLDIFHHRLMALMYRFYRKNRIFLGSTNVKETIIGKILHNLTGLSLFHKQFQFNEIGIYPFFNLFWRNNPSAFGIKQLIGGYFNLQAHVQTFVGGWIYPHPEELSYLVSKSHKTWHKKGYNTLGETLFLGRKAWDNTSGLILRLGPMDFKKYISFIPPMHQNFKVLKELLGYYIGNQYQVRVQLHLKSDTVSALYLGQKSGGVAKATPNSRNEVSGIQSKYQQNDACILDQVEDTSRYLRHGSSFLNFTTWLTPASTHIKDTWVGASL